MVAGSMVVVMVIWNDTKKKLKVAVLTRGRDSRITPLLCSKKEQKGEKFAAARQNSNFQLFLCVIPDDHGNHH